jgi:16S rRNA (guanine527-N7)-methyltransferase
MTEEEAQDWIFQNASVSEETRTKLVQFVDAVIAENAHQNLISATTVPCVWSRHIVDSAQLLKLHSATTGAPWLDLGTGAGFPGIVIALLTSEPIILVESRRKRIEFLRRQIESLGLTKVHLHGGRLETLETRPAGVISARAFAPLPRLLHLAYRFSRKDTVWLLPKGRTVREELESVRSSWQGEFHVKPSLTDAQASIIVATGVSQRKSAR